MSSAFYCNFWLLIDLLQFNSLFQQISMFARQGMQKIDLPPDTKAIRDICILPRGHAVFASLGRKLSLFRSVKKVSVLSHYCLANIYSFTLISDLCAYVLYISAWQPTMLSFNTIYRWFFNLCNFIKLASIFMLLCCFKNCCQKFVPAYISS